MISPVGNVFSRYVHHKEMSTGTISVSEGPPNFSKSSGYKLVHELSV